MDSSEEETKIELKKRRTSKDCDEISKRQKIDANSSTRPKRSITLLETLRRNRGTFTYCDGAITGPCILCSKELSLSWYDWKQHLLEHTEEKRYYCVECNTQMFDTADHTACSSNTIIDVFGDLEVGCSLDGFICQLCDYFQINDYRLMDHLNVEHEELCAFYDIHVTRVTFVPDIRPEEHTIEVDSAYIPRRERYRCGAGYCIFHGNTPIEYSEHFHKAHSIFKTFFCPHCNLMINRKTQPTVAVQNVLHHIETHASTVYQCFNCALIAWNEHEMRMHITDKHSDLVLKFWRNNRRACGSKAPDSELIEIVLDCAFCGERVHNIPAVFAHFTEAHPNHEIHFNAFKHIKTTTRQLKVICSIDDATLHYREVLVCGLCDEYFTDKYKWLQHFSGTHKSQALVAKRDFKWLDLYEPPKKDGFDRNMLFYCAFCENTNGVKLICSGSINGIYDHWKNDHKPTDSKPFRFLMIELVGCGYCDIISTFQGLREHVAKEHPDESFIAIKVFDASKQCALCDYSFNDLDELVEHFHTEHALALQTDVFNPIPLNDFTLWKLLQIAIHKKVKCDYCDGIFETKDEYRTHHSMEHTKLEKASRKFVDKESIKLIGACCQQQIDPQVFYDHLEFHKFTLKCDLCVFVTHDPFEFMKHKVKSHDEMHSLASLYLNFLQIRYWSSELIFGNGLVINKFNTQGNEYDHNQSFEHFATRLVDEKVQEYEMGSKLIGNNETLTDDSDDPQRE